MTQTLAKDLSKWGWAVLIFGAPWSHAAMTAGTCWVVIMALLHWWKHRLPEGRPTGLDLSSPVAWLLGMFVWQGISLAWSADLSWGVGLMKTQLAMLALAWAWLVVPLPTSRLARIWTFQSATLALLGVLIWGAFRWSQGEVFSSREWTPWMSHIRLSLLAALALVWGVREQPKAIWLGFTVLWALFLMVTGALTSALFLPLAFLWGAYESSNPKTRSWILGLGSMGTVGALTFGWLWLQPVPLPMDMSNLPAFSSQGNAYVHRPEKILSEGGHRVNLYLCPSEWDDAWDSVSEQPLSTLNPHGFPTRDRMIRYLTSKGWPKDAEHILKLSKEDVKAIEGGATNAVAAKGIALRLREFRHEWEAWKDGGNPSGHAVMQRFAHWKAGLLAWSQAPWFGHGIGSLPMAMDEAYKRTNTRLQAQHQHRAHMQHLTWGVSGGVIAWILWVGFWCTWFKKWGRFSRTALWGGVVVALSCVFEDGWETQAGIVVGFLALFISQTRGES